MHLRVSCFIECLRKAWKHTRFQIIQKEFWNWFLLGEFLLLFNVTYKVYFFLFELLGFLMVLPSKNLWANHTHFFFNYHFPHKPQKWKICKPMRSLRSSHFVLILSINGFKILTIIKHVLHFTRLRIFWSGVSK